jgi:hypothetical protein
VEKALLKEVLAGLAVGVAVDHKVDKVDKVYQVKLEQMALLHLTVTFSRVMVAGRLGGRAAGAVEDSRLVEVMLHTPQVLVLVAAQIMACRQRPTRAAAAAAGAVQSQAALLVAAAAAAMFY